MLPVAILAGGLAPTLRPITEEIEFAEFLEDIRQNRQPAAGLADAQAALRVVEQVYREAKP